MKTAIELRIKTINVGHEGLIQLLKKKKSKILQRMYFEIWVVAESSGCRLQEQPWHKNLFM